MKVNNWNLSVIIWKIAVVLLVMTVLLLVMAVAFLVVVVLLLVVAVALLVVAVALLVLEVALMVVAVALMVVMIANWCLLALTNLLVFVLALTLLNSLASTLHRTALALNHWIWHLDTSCLHNWDNLLLVNWNLDTHFLNCFTDNWLVNLNDLGDGFINILLNNNILLDVVWNVLLHVHWDLDGNFDGNMYRHSDSFVDGHSLSDFNDVWDLAASGDWNLFNDTFFGAGMSDVTLVDFGSDFTFGLAYWSLMAPLNLLLALLAVTHWSLMA